MGSPGSNGKDQAERPAPANGHNEVPDLFIPNYTFPTPEAGYQYERARAEERFRLDFGIWETVNRENPPQLVTLSVSAAGEAQTERRDDLAIVLSLETYVQQFLFAALAAYGDLLLEKATPATEAVCEFERHADELLKETFNRKWLFGLRRLELLKAAFTERFWPMQEEVVAESRYDFEEDVWSTDVEPVEEPESVRICEPESEPTGSDGTARDHPRKRGPKPDYENALRVAEVVARVTPDGDWRSKLDDVCEALHEEGIPFPKVWRSRDRTCRSWMDLPERDLAFKAIEYRLEIVKQRKKVLPETLS